MSKKWTDTSVGFGHLSDCNIAGRPMQVEYFLPTLAYF